MTPPPKPRSQLRIALWTLFAIANCALLYFVFLRQAPFQPQAHSLINTESILALSFILLALIPSNHPPSQRNPEGRPARLYQRFFATHKLPILLVLLTTILSFANAVDIPLIHDSYTHVAMAAHESLADVLSTFYAHPTAGDFFFRPLGNLSYYIDFKWAHGNPLYWHLASLAIHALTCALVYIFVWQISRNRLVSLISAIVFAVHGSRPEAVSWVAGRFDLISAIFVLLCLISCNLYLGSRRRMFYASMLLSLMLALLSKEAAFCAPLLVLGLLFFKTDAPRNTIIKTAAALLAVCVATFAYRWWLLGGIGGYKTETGDATILRFSLLHTLNALFIRQWAILFFPLNWSLSPGLIAKLAIVLFLTVLIGSLVFLRPCRRYLLGSIFFTLAASLPVQHLLLINQQLTGARVLYLPSLGIAMFWGYLIGSAPENQTLTIRFALVIGLLLSQLAFLQHNLTIWKQTAFLSRNTCHALGDDLSRTGRKAIVTGLPATWHGVYFLGNGFPACVAMNSNAATNQITVANDATPLPGQQTFHWNPATEKLEVKSQP